MNEIRKFRFRVYGSAVVLLLIGDVAHDHGVHGHVEHVHEHRRCHVGDGHYQHGRCDEISHLCGLGGGREGGDAESVKSGRETHQEQHAKDLGV